MSTLWYIGDSTVARNNIHSYPQTGMSQGLSLYLKASVRLESHAKNGRSTKSFLDEGRFAPVESGMRPGDFLLIQFGHNDEKDDPARHTDPDTTFRENLLRFVDAAKKAGACPVLLTPIARRLFDEKGVFLPGSHGPYPEAVKRTAREAGVPVIDLTTATENFLALLGDEDSRPLFVWPKDNTHLKYDGAVKMAGFVAQGLYDLGSPYADLLAGTDEGADK
jgi:lysophospholipase L1-like esterase